MEPLTVASNQMLNVEDLFPILHIENEKQFFSTQFPSHKKTQSSILSYQSGETKLTPPLSGN